MSRVCTSFRYYLTPARILQIDGDSGEAMMTFYPNQVLPDSWLKFSPSMYYQRKHIMAELAAPPPPPRGYGEMPERCPLSCVCFRCRDEHERQQAFVIPEFRVPFLPRPTYTIFGAEITRPLRRVRFSL